MRRFAWIVLFYLLLLYLIILHLWITTQLLNIMVPQAWFPLRILLCNYKVELHMQWTHATHAMQAPQRTHRTQRTQPKLQALALTTNALKRCPRSLSKCTRTVSDWLLIVMYRRKRRSRHRRRDRFWVKEPPPGQSKCHHDDSRTPYRSAFCFSFSLPGIFF